MESHRRQLSVLAWEIRIFWRIKGEQKPGRRAQTHTHTLRVILPPLSPFEFPPKVTTVVLLARASCGQEVVRAAALINSFFLLQDARKAKTYLKHSVFSKIAFPYSYISTSCSTTLSLDIHFTYQFQHRQRMKVWTLIPLLLLFVSWHDLGLLSADSWLAGLR